MANKALPILLTLGIVTAVAWWGARSMLWTPDEEEPVDVQCAASAPAWDGSEPLKVVVWNIQYAGSRKHHFFYDGGEAVQVPPSDVADTLDEITRVLEELQPDVVLLQEVDRGSTRTGRVDQHAELMERLRFPCGATAPYHKVGYVPYPSGSHLGKVDMHLTVMSRYQLTDARRIQLALLDEPTWRQAFNLRRALLDVGLKTSDGTEVRLGNTHLSAFSYDDGTLDKQMRQLNGWATALEKFHHKWILAGDLNSLLPGDKRDRLGDDAKLYAADGTPVQLLYDRFQPWVALEQAQDWAQDWRTYVPFGGDKPDRVLDYAFVSREFVVKEPKVVQEMGISDHLPLYFEVSDTP